MSNPYGDTDPAEERPQPRYGAYAPRTGGSEGSETRAEGSEPGAEGSETGPGAGSGEQRGAYGAAGQGGQHNPYGQPSWGQPGGAEAARSGGQPGPYGADPYGGQHGGQPGAAAQQGWPQGDTAASGGYPGPASTHKPKRPTTLVLSMVLMLVAGGLSLIWGIYVLVSMQTEDAEALMSPEMREVMTESFQTDPQLQQLSQEEALEMLLMGFGVFALVWSLVLLAIYVTLAFVGTMTGNVGRVLATIWLAGSVLFLLLGYDATSYTIIGLTVIASIVALILLWLPASNTFVQQRRAVKEAQRRGSYGGYQSGPPPGYGGAQQPGAGQPGTGQGPQNPYGGTNPYGN